MRATRSNGNQVTTLLSLLAILTGSFLVGCGDSDSANATHAHEDSNHDHSHHQGKPLHGGRIVSIGHTHGGDDVTQFHAEIMPVTDKTIRIYLLAESDAGETKDISIDSKEIPALISIKGRDSIAIEAPFQAVVEGDAGSAFSMTLPDPLVDGEAFLVVVPKIMLGGLPQNFSFSATRPTTDGAGESVEETGNE